MLPYAAVEAILARMFEADKDVQGKAFRGRLKHLKRLGIPLGSSPGKGKKVGYSDEFVSQWAFCLSMAEFGIDPTVIADFVHQHWSTEIFPMFEDAAARPARGEVLFYAFPKLMSRAWTDSAGLEFGKVYSTDLEQWSQLFVRKGILLVNLSFIVEMILFLRSDEEKSRGLPVTRLGRV